jgi:hypothetical protein
MAYEDLVLRQLRLFTHLESGRHLLLSSCYDRAQVCSKSSFERGNKKREKKQVRPLGRNTEWEGERGSSRQAKSLRQWCRTVGLGPGVLPTFVHASISEGQVDKSLPWAKWKMPVDETGIGWFPS